MVTENHEILEAIADGLLAELKKRYPLISIIKYKLAAPGFLLGSSDLGVPDAREFAVKVTAGGVLIDIDRNPTAGRSYHQRLATIEYSDPAMFEKVFAKTDDFVEDGRLVPW